jgi:hypothetical protein
MKIFVLLSLMYSFNSMAQFDLLKPKKEIELENIDTQKEDQIKNQLKESFCLQRAQDKMRVSLNIDLENKSALAELAFQTGIGPVSIDKFADVLFSERKVPQDGEAYLVDFLSAFDDLDYPIVSAHEFTASSSDKEEDITRVYYVLTNSENEKFLIVKNPNFYYFGKTTVCKDLGI